jgi:hypothetical protein
MNATLKITKLIGKAITAHKSASFHGVFFIRSEYFLPHNLIGCSGKHAFSPDLGFVVAYNENEFHFHLEYFLDR